MNGPPVMFSEQLPSKREGLRFPGSDRGVPGSGPVIGSFDPASYTIRVWLILVHVCLYVHAWRGTRIGLRGWGGLLHRWRHGDPGRADDRAAGALDLATQQKPLAFLLDFHHLRAVQVLDHVGPLEVVSVPCQPRPQFLAQH